MYSKEHNALITQQDQSKIISTCLSSTDIYWSFYSKIKEELIKKKKDNENSLIDAIHHLSADYSTDIKNKIYITHKQMQEHSQQHWIDFNL